jgi:hypothetical protein
MSISIWEIRMSETEKDRLHRLRLEQVMVRRADMHMWDECMAIPNGLLESNDSNYSSAMNDAAVYGTSPLASATEHVEMLRKLRESISDRSINSANAYLILPPEIKQKVAYLSEDIVAEPALKVAFRHRMDYMPVIYNRFAMTDIGGSEPRRPPYKPRPLPEEVAPASLAQWLVLFGVGILILSMMFSAVRSL